MSHERDIKELIEQMTRQQQMSGFMPSQKRPDDFNMGTDQSPHLSNQINTNGVDQSPIDQVNSVRRMGKPISKTPRSELMKQTEIPGGCPQCGTLHPPLQPGQKCPLANLKVKTESGEEKKVDVNKFLADFKNVILSQIEIKKVKDVEKLFKNIIVELTKFLEGYSE